MANILKNESDKIRGKEKMDGDDSPKKAVKKESYKDIMLSHKFNKGEINERS